MVSGFGRPRAAAAVVLLVTWAAAAVAAPEPGGGRSVVADGGKIAVEFDRTLRSRVVSREHGREVLGPFKPSEFVTVGNTDITRFALTRFTSKPWADSLGKGKQYEISGTAGRLVKTVSVVSYDEHPTMLLFQVTYTNAGKDTVAIDGWTNNRYSLRAAPGAAQGRPETPPFWSYQPGSYGWDNDWVLPLQPGFSRENFLGMTAADYGGGTPVVDVWRPDRGIAVGHVELVPKFVSLPVRMAGKTEAELGVTYSRKVKLPPGGSLSTFRTFVQVHTGDHFNSLTVYRQFMERQGIAFREAPEGAYESIWCGWGYEQNFTMEQMYNTLPKVKEVGFDWVVLDMGWYKGLGDYALPADKFPRGEADIRRFVDSVHAMGLKVQLWWMPLAVAPNTELMEKNPGYLLVNEDGSPRYMPSFFKSFFLCPGSPEVREYSRLLIRRFMDWGFDGLKIDGYNINCVPLCYNPAHHHVRPEESVEALPSFFRMVYETALESRKDAVVEVCPCGTNQSFFILPYMNQTVASDPHTSWHVRLKGKTIHAMTGSKTAYFGDHVELLVNNRSDFASTVGVGGVIGTKFVYPPGVHMNSESGDVSLTPDKEAIWKKWVALYKTNMISRGVYRGELYDLGFDRPETHAIQKADTMYYAFFAPDFRGEVTLRGLEDRSYTFIDYENNVELDGFTSATKKLRVAFKDHLLLKAQPRRVP